MSLHQILGFPTKLIDLTGSSDMILTLINDESLSKCSLFTFQ